MTSGARVLGINLDGPMFTMRRAVRHMVSQGGGSIVNIASTAGHRGRRRWSRVHGVEARAGGADPQHCLDVRDPGRALQRDLPGRHRTNIAETMPVERLDRAGAARAQTYAGLIPATLDPEDIAALALFLASDESRHINGAIIPADAGWTAA